MQIRISRKGVNHLSLDGESVLCGTTTVAVVNNPKGHRLGDLVDCRTCRKGLGLPVTRKLGHR